MLHVLTLSFLITDILLFDIIEVLMNGDRNLLNNRNIFKFNTFQISFLKIDNDDRY